MLPEEDTVSCFMGLFWNLWQFAEKSWVSEPHFCTTALGIGDSKEMWRTIPVLPLWCLLMPALEQHPPLGSSQIHTKGMTPRNRWVMGNHTSLLPQLFNFVFFLSSPIMLETDVLIQFFVGEWTNTINPHCPFKLEFKSRRAKKEAEGSARQVS